jgi:molybdopterin synthase sulfur carrier subunit
MAIRVRIPTPLRKLTNGADEVSAEGATVLQALNSLEKDYPGLKERICEPDGRLRRFVNIYLNDEDIRFKNNLETELKDSDEISIIPAIAGGSLADRQQSCGQR